MLQEVAEEIEKTARSVTDQVHTAMPGKIVSYAQGFVSVKPYGKFWTSNGESMDYPVISKVPLVFPFCNSANVGIGFPVKSGDDCLLIISEVELDAWMLGGNSESPLRFDLTSAIAIPGIMKKESAIVKKAISENAVVVGTPSCHLSVSSSGVKVKGNLYVDGNIEHSGDCTKR